MLVELSVVEQRYQAVLAVIRDGVPVVQVASRYGVSRQAVHRWLRWYEDQGLPGSRLPGADRIAVRPVLSSFRLTGSPAEGIHDGTVLHFDQTGALDDH